MNENNNISTCIMNNCSLTTHNALDKCSLHCSKNEYNKDFNSSLLCEFYKDFKSYVLDQLFSHKSILSEKYNKHNIEVYFSQNKFDDEEINKVLKEQIIIPTNIVFPSRDDRDPFDYQKFLNLFGEIHFNSCEFYLTSLNLNDIKVFFQDCIFHTRWILQNYKVLENIDSVIYQTCTFKDDISNYTPDENRKYYLLESNQFDYTCIFEKKLTLSYVQFDGLLFNTEQGNYLEEKLEINEISLENCIFNSRIIMNRFKIDDFSTKNTIFENKFEFKENSIGKHIIENTNFKKLMDCYSSEFEEFSITKSIFDDFVGFENCKFGKENDIQKSFVAQFTYATFLNFINFRNTEFYSGLNLENANLKESPNFLKSKIELTHTNRETIRIIKHSFERIGNTIEGNKYFSKEMQKYKQELETKNWTNNFQEKVVFNINAFVSDFGQNYVKPIGIIMVISILHYFIILGYEANLLYKIYEPLNVHIEASVNFFNSLAKNLLPFKNFLKDDMEFLSLIFGIVYSTLIWQTIVAVKMHTKRG